MSLPVNITHVIRSTMDRNCYQPVEGTDFNGAINVGAHNDTAHDYPNALLIQAPGHSSGGDRDYAEVVHRTYRTEYAEPSGSRYQNEATRYVRAKLVLGGTPGSGGSYTFVRAYGDGGYPNHDFQLFRNDSGNLAVYFRVANTTTNSSVSLPLDEVFEIRWHYSKSTASNGVLSVDVLRDGDGDWVNALNITNHTSTANSGAIGFTALRGPVENSGTHNLETAVLSVGHSVTGYSDIPDDPSFDFQCSVNHARHNRVTATSWIDSGSYRNATKVRVQYGLASGSIDDNSSSYSSLVAYNASGTTPAVHIPVTGLAANTAYQLRFQLADSGDNVIATGETYTFTTPPSPGVSSPTGFTIGCCFDQYAAPHAAIGLHATELASESITEHSRVWIGDRFYENHAVFSNDDSMVGADDFAGVIAYNQEVDRDPNIIVAKRAAPQTIIFDDHPYNNINKNWQGSATNLSTEGTWWSGSSATLDDAWTSFEDYRTDLDAANPTSRTANYFAYTTGKVRVIHLDTRFEQDPTANEFMSSAQETWLYNELSNLSATNPYVLIVAQGVMDEVATQDDSPYTISATQCQELIDHIVDNAPDYARVVFAVGDTHAGYHAHRLFRGTSGIVTSDKLVANVLASPMGMPLVQTSAKPDYGDANLTGKIIYNFDDTRGGTVPGYSSPLSNSDIMRTGGTTIQFLPATNSVRFIVVEGQDSAVATVDETFAMAALPATSNTFSQFVRFNGEATGNITPMFTRDEATRDFGGNPVAADEIRWDHVNRGVVPSVKMVDTGADFSASHTLEQVGGDFADDTPIFVGYRASNESVRVFRGEDLTSYETASFASGSADLTALGAPANHTYLPKAVVVWHGLVVLACQRSVSGTVKGVTLLYTQDYGATWSYVQARDISGTLVTADVNTAIGDIPDITNDEAITAVIQSWSMSAFPKASLSDTQGVRITLTDYQAQGGSPGGGQVIALEATRTTSTGQWTLGDARLIYDEPDDSGRDGRHSHAAAPVTGGIISSWGDTASHACLYLHEFDWDSYETATVTADTIVHGDQVGNPMAGTPQPLAPQPWANNQAIWAPDEGEESVIITGDLTTASDNLVIGGDRRYNYDGELTYPEGNAHLHSNYCQRHNGSGRWVVGGTDSLGDVPILSTYSDDGTHFSRIKFLSSGDAHVGTVFVGPDGFYRLNGSNLERGSFPQLRVGRGALVAPGGNQVIDGIGPFDATFSPGTGVVRNFVTWDDVDERWEDWTTGEAESPAIDLPGINPATFAAYYRAEGSSADGGRRYLTDNNPQSQWAQIDSYILCAAVPTDAANATFWLWAQMWQSGLLSGREAAGYSISKNDDWSFVVVHQNASNLTLDTNAQGMMRVYLQGSNNGTKRSSAGLYLQAIGWCSSKPRVTYPILERNDSDQPNEILDCPITCSTSSWSVGVLVQRDQTNPTGGAGATGLLATIYGDANNYIEINDAATTDEDGGIDVAITSGGSLVDTISLADKRLYNGDQAYIIITSDGVNIDAYADLTLGARLSGTSANQLATQPTLVRFGGDEAMNIRAHAVGAEQGTFSSNQVDMEFSRLSLLNTVSETDSLAYRLPYRVPYKLPYHSQT